MLCQSKPQGQGQAFAQKPWLALHRPCQSKFADFCNRLEEIAVSADHRTSHDRPPMSKH